MVRIAIWSGPRNISTALMRSWGNRPDTVVCDEPLYAYYLKRTGIQHPGREEILAHHETDWRRVVQKLIGSPPIAANAAGQTPQPPAPQIFYQKHMAHHLLPEIERDWLAHLSHALLIRDPREMLTSLVKTLPNPHIDATGLPQQLALLGEIEAQCGKRPPIIDARDVLLDPRGMLTRLCRALDVPFLEQMLSWPAGRRATDGVWAPHWYAAVERSTGFEPYRPKSEPVPAELDGLLAECMRIYAELHAQRLR